MENSTEEDFDNIDLIQYQITIDCLVTFSLAALLLQLFIVAVNVIDWMKGRAITGSDKIITALGISRIFFHGSYLMILFTVLYQSSLPEIIQIFSVFTLKASSFADIWLSTLISIFFYFMISTFHNVLLVRLKAILSRRVIHLITAFMLLSVLHSCMFYVVEYSNISTQNDTLSYGHKEMISFVYTVWTVLPFLMNFVASFLLIILLGVHLSRMKIRGNVTSSTEPYRRTMMFTLVTFLACAFYLVDNLSPKMKMETLISLWFDNIKNAFPVIHSVLLIYVATKLRNHFLGIVHCKIISFCN